MKDYGGNIQYKGKNLSLIFNLNVMEKIQEEYGTIDAWGELTDGTAYAKKAYEAENHKKAWESLTNAEKAKYSGEPDVKAVIFGYTEMLNEGVDIANEENGTNEPFFTKKQVGRIITEIGLANATKELNKTVVESSKGDRKNA